MKNYKGGIIIKAILNILKGTAIGIANVIPGVSGGTIALLLGIYERLLDSVGNFFFDKNKIKERFIFIFTILIGVILGIGLFAKIIKIANEKYPEPTSFFFIGLIIASIPFLIKQYEKKKTKFCNILFFIIGAFIVLTLMFFDKSSINSNILNENITLLYGVKLFFAGIIAAGTMVIPGVSGSFLLILLGEYYNILNFIDKKMILPLFIFAIGAGIGILLFSKIISLFLTKYKDATMSFIIGLVIASIFKIFIGFTFNGILPILNIASFVIGFAMAYFLGKSYVKK